MTNSVGQINQNLSNENPVCNSKYVSGFGGEVTKGNYALTTLQLNIQSLSSLKDNSRQIVSNGQPDVLVCARDFWILAMNCN